IIGVLLPPPPPGEDVGSGLGVLNTPVVIDFKKSLLIKTIGSTYNKLNTKKLILIIIYTCILKGIRLNKSQHNINTLFNVAKIK
ncbi:hypothetical protein JKG47_22180, partial [Acidithiobacillus sp. MC6.1]|nr:hypothetical protein [Acidithiobacillus sp. MC6.1]